MISMAASVVLSFAISCMAMSAFTNSQEVTYPTSDLVCTLSVPKNKTLLDSLPKYFDNLSNTLVLEYAITFNDDHSSLDLVNSSRSFQPWRWFRTQGCGSSQLLLVYNYYFGLLMPFLRLATKTKNFQLDANPPGCFNNSKSDEMIDVIRLFLLQDFNLDKSSAKAPFTPSDKVDICNAFIDDIHGMGSVAYNCCSYTSDKILNCHKVFYNTSVWLMDSFVLALSFLLFLYMPAYIPEGCRAETYIYDSPKDLRFNVVFTKEPAKYTIVRKAEIVQQKVWAMFNALNKQSGVTNKPLDDHLYSCRVKRAEFRVSMYKLFVEGGRTVYTRRYLFNTFIRCKLRRYPYLEDCCRTPACGIHCCHRFPTWISWLKAFRTIFAMGLLALPSVPLMYAIAGDHMYYQEILEAYSQRGLTSPFHALKNPYFGKIIVAVITLVCVVHGILLIKDQATNNTVYADLLKFDEDSSIREHLRKMQDIVRGICEPIRKYGILFLPVWILGAVLAGAYLFLFFIWNSPMGRVLKSSKKIIYLFKKQKERGKQKRPIEVVAFALSSFVAVLVLTVSANFLVHVLAMSVVVIVVEADLMYKVLPVLLLFFIYTRDSYYKVGKRFDDFLATLVSTINECKMYADVRRECLKKEVEQRNKMFQIRPDDVIDATSFVSVDDVGTSVGIETSEELNEETPKISFLKRKPSLVKTLNKPFVFFRSLLSIRDEITTNTKKMFEMKDKELVLRLRQPVVFLDKRDFLHIPKKFLFDCATIDCAGVPGTLGENYIKATIEFMKIGTFILLVFLVIMAYGSIYNISPTNQLFVTLVTGLIPLIIRNIFIGGSRDESFSSTNYRFLVQLREKIESFSQRWILKSMDCEDLKHVVQGNELKNYCVNSPTEEDDIDLVVVVDSTESNNDPPRDAENAPTSSAAQATDVESRSFKTHSVKSCGGPSVRKIEPETTHMMPIAWTDSGITEYENAFETDRRPSILSRLGNGHSRRSKSKPEDGEPSSQLPYQKMDCVLD